MDEGVFDLDCGNRVRHPSAQLAEADWSPYCCAVGAAAAVVAEDLTIASKGVKESRSCPWDSRDMVRSPGGSVEGSCTGRWRAMATGMRSGSDN